MTEFRYVPLNQQHEYIKRGWRVMCKLPGHHGQYCVFMEKLPWWRRIIAVFRYMRAAG